jgi:hypothetical protein
MRTNRSKYSCAYIAVASVIITASLITAGAVISTSALAYGIYQTPATSYIHSGDKVILNQPISTPGGAKIFLQNGKVKKRSDVREATPYCYFHLRRSSELIDTEASLSSEQFTVARTNRQNEMVQSNQPWDQPRDQPQKVIALTIFNQDSSEKTLTTRIFLASDNQPEVIGLNCSVWAVPYERSHVTLEEIRKALGDVVTLNLAAQ